MSKFKWAIIGAGNIAHKFADGLMAVPDAQLYAVASREAEKARAFADKYDAPVAYGSYEELADDSNIDCVYIATPHPMHMPNALLCMNKGLNVLCEKPLAVNKKEAQAMVDLSKSKNVFLMEAFWTRFLLSIRKANEWISQGKIGEVRMMHCDFGFRAEIDPQARLFNNALAGGGLLDVGCYTISMATMLFGNSPDIITGAAHIGVTNIDEQAAMVLRFPKGELAVLSAGVRTDTYHNLHIFGTDGNISLPGFWNTSKATLNENGKDPVYFEELVGNGYNYEAASAMESIRAGKIENDIMTHADSLAIAKISDELRKQWGLSFPSDLIG
jgi:predicted dehydrogenase